jgi:Dynein heavy chain AAA lid domain
VFVAACLLLPPGLFFQHKARRHLSTHRMHPLALLPPLLARDPQERRRYGVLGWNVPHEFSASDLDAARATLRMLVGSTPSAADDASTMMPWAALHHIIGEINYGGRCVHPAHCASGPLCIHS